ncbi:MAG: MoaD/ThiS family protein [Terriglobales bacterium]
MITLVLPHPLRALAGLSGDALLEVPPPVTTRRVLDALEARYPMLCGTVRDHASGERRPYVRFYACGEDLSLESTDQPLPEAVAGGSEPFLIIGAIAGGS